MLVPFVFVTFSIGTLIGFPAPFEIVDSVSRGKIVVARKNFLPGEIVTEDKEPLLTVNWPQNQRIDDVSMATNSFLEYTHELSPVQKGKFMTLFGPTTGQYADRLRSMARKISKIDRKTGQVIDFTTEEIETFVKVANIVKINCFGFDEGGFGVFDKTSRFAHSCLPNCKHDVTGRSCLVRAIVPIRAGEELTFSYNDGRELEPTHIRRQKYLDNKEFTCHCPRCDAEGDDTRQFDCFDPVCKGVMMVCQPINKEALPISGLSYTGVEYVEPHLLPCTVCKLTPPPSYTADMLEMERGFEAVSSNVIDRCASIVKTGVDAIESAGLLNEIEKYSYPRRHVGAMSIAHSKVNCQAMLYARRSVNYNTTHRAVRDLLEWYDTMLPFPSVIVCQNILQVCVVCDMSTNLPVPLFHPSEMKELWQKYLRLRLILLGRQNRDEKVDRFLLKVLEKLPPLQSTDLCAFCEESPQRAALTLSRCDRCRQVAYCSVGCQEAHWKLHKRTCENSNE